jgi:hypothetical protein
VVLSHQPIIISAYFLNTNGATIHKAESEGQVSSQMWNTLVKKVASNEYIIITVSNKKLSSIVVKVVDYGL